MRKKLGPYIELGSAAAIAGSSVAVGKLITGGFPVFLSQILSLTAALLVLLPLSIYRERGIPKMTFRDLLYQILQALTGMFLFRVFMLYGLKYTSALEGGIITCSTPAITAALSFTFLKEKISREKILGIVLTVSGLISINIGSLVSSGEANHHAFLGNGMILLAVICESLLTVFRKASSKSISSTTGTTLVTLFSLLLFLPFGVYEASSFDFYSVSSQQWLYVAYYGFIVTALAYILWFRGVSSVPVSTAAVFSGCMPASAVFLSFFLLREEFKSSHLLGILFVLAGIGLVTFYEERNLKIQEL